MPSLAMLSATDHFHYWNLVVDKDLRTHLTIGGRQVMKMGQNKASETGGKLQSYAMRTAITELQLIAVLFHFLKKSRKNEF